MSLQGRTVRITIGQPLDWNLGNLFGTIVSDRGGQKLQIKLSKVIEGKKFLSDIIELKNQLENETFNILAKFGAVEIEGWLLKDNSNESEFLITGNVVID